CRDRTRGGSRPGASSDRRCPAATDGACAPVLQPMKPAASPRRGLAARAGAPRSALLARLAATLPELRKSERTVAERVLERPNEVLHLSMAEMAKRVGASQPTIARFAAAMGFSGYKEFKLRLAQSLASGVPFVHQDVRPDDTVELVTSKVFD